MAANFKNWYDILGVKQNASQSEILSAWRKLAVKYHPDHNKDSPAYAEKKMKEINEAKSVLTNQAEKRKFDLELNERNKRRNSNNNNFNDALRRYKEQQVREEQRKKQEEQRKQREALEKESLAKRKKEKKKTILTWFFIIAGLALFIVAILILCGVIKIWY